MNATCDGCDFLSKEHFGTGRFCQRCMKPGERFGRVLIVGNEKYVSMRGIERPAWCHKEEKNAERI